MAEIKLFKISNNAIHELESKSILIEKELQTLIEKNMEEFFAIKFLVTEYSIDNGRIDSLGIDENHCPVIFEYKRFSSENIINQGLFYMDWLLRHKDSFYLLVMKKYGAEEANKIDWSSPQLYCIANDFTKFDENAIKQMNRNISLYRYRKYDQDLICFELLGSNYVASVTESKNNKIGQIDFTFNESYKKTSLELKQLYNEIRDYILSFGDDVIENQLKLYRAFKKIKNFICVEIFNKCIVCYLKINPKIMEIKDSNIRDVSNIGHWGTGDLEVTIRSKEQFEKAKDLLYQAYIIN